MTVLDRRHAASETITVLTDDPELVTAGWRRRLGALGCEVRLLDEEGLLAARPPAPAIVVLLAAGPRAQRCPAVVERLRRRLDVPVLVATESGAEEQAVEALRNGADTFLPLPYSPERLEQALSSLAGVGGPRPQGPPEKELPTPLRQDEPGEVLTAGDVRLDRARHEVTHRGRLVTLPLREFGLLRMFLENADRVVLVEDLLERFWGTRQRTPRNMNSLSVHVKRLRTRLGDDCGEPRLLVTVRGVGYRLSPAPPD